MGSIDVIAELTALERCERCGLIGPGHTRSLCAAAIERRRLWSDGWVDLAALWPAATPTEAEAWAETRPGPGFMAVHGGLGLVGFEVRQTAWVRHEDPSLTGLSVAACVGLHALRPDRSLRRVARQVLGLGAGGLRSLARPNGFEVPVRCAREVHRLAVVDGRLVSGDHPELRGQRRPKHRRAVDRTRWMQSLETTPVPLLLDGVLVAAGPDGRSCHKVVTRWNAGLHRTQTLDLTVGHGTWTTPPELAATIAAGVVLERAARARLLLEVVDATDGDLAADVQVALLPPGAEPAIDVHHQLSSLRVCLPSDAQPPPLRPA